MTAHRVPEHRTSHNELLDFAFRPARGAAFDAIVVPTNRKVHVLEHCLELASREGVPLIVACSKRVTKREVIEAAASWNVEVYAVDLTPKQVNPFDGISFATSTDEDLLAFTSGRTRDLSAKRNLGLVIARRCKWRRVMFMDDDILEVSADDVAALAAALEDHNVSVLIPDEYPDNSVVCHANRLGGGPQGKFASAGAMGVRCDRDDLSFFPNIYNEDWFFFSEEAANLKIAKVGRSRQMPYNPYADPARAVKEEFGDLLAEGLYAGLEDLRSGLSSDDVISWEEFIKTINEAYWEEFIKTRGDFLDNVAQMLAARLNTRRLKDGEDDEIRAAQVSVSAARGQLTRIDRNLCQKFINLWQSDLARWRDYLASNEPLHKESIGQALDYLGLDYLVYRRSR